MICSLSLRVFAWLFVFPRTWVSISLSLFLKGWFEEVDAAMGNCKKRYGFMMTNSAEATGVGLTM